MATMMYTCGELGEYGMLALGGWGHDTCEVPTIKSTVRFLTALDICTAIVDQIRNTLYFSSPSSSNERCHVRPVSAG